MSSPPSPSNRRRRWIVLTIAVLLLASLVSGWYWPRGDARFVGKWSADVPGTPDVPNGLGTAGTIELCLNGRGKFRRADGSLAISFRWHVEGDEFVMGSAPQGVIARALDWASTKLSEVGGWTFLPIEERYSIVDVSTDVIDLVSPNRDTLRMTRILE